MKKEMFNNSVTIVFRGHRQTMLGFKGQAGQVKSYERQKKWR